MRIRGAVIMFVLCALAPARALAGNFWDLPTSDLKTFLASGQIVVERRENGDLDAWCRCPIVLRAVDIPHWVAKAIVAIEDERFFERGDSAVDLRGLLGAFKDTITGRISRGASTIPMQLLKNVALYETDTWKRKAHELSKAHMLIGALGEDELLAAYLNQVTYAGRDIVGLHRAALHYFGVEPRSLSLYQSAFLAGVVQRPGRFDWVRRARAGNLEQAIARRASAHRRAVMVLGKMVEKTFITAAQRDGAVREGERALAIPPAAPKGADTYALSDQAFVQWVVSSLAREHPALVPQKPRSSIRLVTTYQPFVQRVVERELSAMIASGKVPREYEVAAVAMDPEGRVAAMIGSRDWKQLQLNQAVAARVQVGSTAKLATYAAACEAKPGASAKSRVVDEPNAAGWPANSDGRYRGAVTWREAMAQSLNAAAVRIAEDTGLQKVMDAARRLGMAPVTAGASEGADHALGSWSSNPLAMTSAYASIANGGHAVAPTGAIGAVDGLGAAHVFDAPDKRSVLSSHCVAVMRDLLKAVVAEGTGRAAKPTIGTAFGKTGTTSDNTDVWFIGWSGQHVIGAWMGRKRSEAGETITSKVPAELFGRVASALGERDGRRKASEQKIADWHGGKTPSPDLKPGQSGRTPVAASRPGGKTPTQVAKRGEGGTTTVQQSTPTKPPATVQGKRPPKGATAAR